MTLRSYVNDTWLRDQAREARHDAIAAYASELAGTDLDLDRELELAGIERLLKSVPLFSRNWTLTEAYFPAISA
ncbi:MAG TPA: hypothetical protein VFW83_04470 [Bryobacteraceae bacterium]|nr:hypothetical protein [Bryobacteraceae bacterium]